MCACVVPQNPLGGGVVSSSLVPVSGSESPPPKASAAATDPSLCSGSRVDLPPPERTRRGTRQGLAVRLSTRQCQRQRFCAPSDVQTSRITAYSPRTEFLTPRESLRAGTAVQSCLLVAVQFAHTTPLPGRPASPCPRHTHPKSAETRRRGRADPTASPSLTCPMVPVPPQSPKGPGHTGF